MSFEIINTVLTNLLGTSCVKTTKLSWKVFGNACANNFFSKMYQNSSSFGLFGSVNSI